MDKRLYTTQEVAQQLSLGHSTVKAMVASGAIQSIKVARSRRIPGDYIDEYLNKIRSQQGKAPRTA